MCWENWSGASATPHRVEGVIHADAELVELVWVELGSKPLADLHPMTKNVLGELQKRLATGPLRHDAQVPFFHFYGGRVHRDVLGVNGQRGEAAAPPPSFRGARSANPESRATTSGFRVRDFVVPRNDVRFGKAPKNKIIFCRLAMAPPRAMPISLPPATIAGTTGPWQNVNSSSAPSCVQSAFTPAR